MSPFPIPRTNPIPTKEVNALAATSGILNRDSVIYDTSASAGIFNDHKWFKSLDHLTRAVGITGANGQVSPNHQGGTVVLRCRQPDGEECNLTFRSAMLSRRTPLNLLSAGKLRRMGIIFDGYNNRLVHKEAGHEVANIV
ncbi:hypothetical protein QBC36DRAFT_290795 [Triangularia setosa]|uniref:Uncharacterized protein n=1 Tax=Triangularia setosa TaxID=2587417 RepID=A0AAN7A5J9_9PEZI|nr:hypothetical protein QBC36DRAFT_290795 [Podospora setosa]